MSLATYGTGKYLYLKKEYHNNFSWFYQKTGSLTTGLQTWLSMAIDREQCMSSSEELWGNRAWHIFQMKRTDHKSWAVAKTRTFHLGASVEVELCWKCDHGSPCAPTVPEGWCLILLLSVRRKEKYLHYNLIIHHESQFPSNRIMK